MEDKIYKYLDAVEKTHNEVYPLSEKRGGGIIKIEAWKDANRKIVKYRMAYINHLIYSNDNGRVLGYDNAYLSPQALLWRNRTR